MNVFKQMIWSVAGVEKYPILMKLKGGRCVRYIMFLTFIYTFCFMGVSAIKDLVTTNGLHDIINEYVPEFELKNGVLKMDEVYELDEDGMLISIDTSYSYLYQYSSDDFYYAFRDYDIVFLADSERMVIKTDREFNEMSFKQLGLEFNKSTLHDWLIYVYIIMVITLLFVWFVNNLVFLFGTLFVALAGMGINAILHTKLTFGQVFKLSVYAQTLMMLLKSVLVIPRMVFGGFVFVSFAVSVAYLAFGMQRIRMEME